MLIGLLTIAALIPQLAPSQQAALPAPANLRVIHLSANAPA